MVYTPRGRFGNYPRPNPPTADFLDPICNNRCVKVYDVFPFFNEIDLLEIRLEYLSKFVDYFVITEATTTFSGEKKPLYFFENRDRFKKFEHQIIHQIVENVPNLSPFERDRYQRDCAKKILIDHCGDEDLLIYGDVDEIPELLALKKSPALLSGSVQICHFAQEQFYFFLNVQETSNSLRSYTGEYPRVFRKRWLGTNVSKWRYAQKFTMTELRNPSHKKNGARVSHGGWHFTYIGSADQQPVAERVRVKIESSAHQELNTFQIINSIESNVENLRDIFPRKRTRFRVRKDLTFLPDNVFTNLDKYEYLIKK